MDRLSHFFLNLKLKQGLGLIIAEGTLLKVLLNNLLEQRIFPVMLTRAINSDVQIVEQDDFSKVVFKKQ